MQKQITFYSLFHALDLEFGNKEKYSSMQFDCTVLGTLREKEFFEGTIYKHVSMDVMDQIKNTEFMKRDRINEISLVVMTAKLTAVVKSVNQEYRFALVHLSSEKVSYQIYQEKRNVYDGSTYMYWSPVGMGTLLSASKQLYRNLSYELSATHTIYHTAFWST